MFDGFWYRCEVKSYSVADEYGDHAYTTKKVEWTKYAVMRETPKGVWLSWVPLTFIGPDRFRETPFTSRISFSFVVGKSRKQLACPTREAALADAITRKKYHISMCQARLSSAQQELDMLAHEINRGGFY